MAYYFMRQKASTSNNLGRSGTDKSCSFYLKMKKEKMRRVKEVFENINSSIERFLFFGRNSSIHGLSKIFAENTFTLIRIFWILIVVISAGCLYLLLEPVVQRGDQVNFTPDTRYPQWETTFPAVTVCEIYNAKMTQRKFAALFPDLMEPLSYDFRKYLTELVYARGSCGKSVCVPCGEQVPCDVPWRTIIEKVHKKCTEMVTDCRFNNITFDCCQKFRLVDSEYGYCFSFNTLQSEKSLEEPLYIVNITTGPGLLTFRLLYEAQISVHSPEELSTNTLDVKFKFDIKPNLYNRADFLFSIIEMENDPVLSAENTNVRGCRDLEEVPDEALHTYPVYSYGACRLAEDTKHMFDHCGCVHPARDSSYKDHYCNFTGMNCMIVAEVQKQKLGVDDHEDDDGDCLPSCVESELTTIHISRRWVHEEPYQGTLASVRMAALPTLRYKRNLIRTNLDFVVTIGGMVSLFFAASILSIAEIFYLILRSQKRI